MLDNFGLHVLEMVWLEEKRMVKVAAILLFG